MGFALLFLFENFVLDCDRRELRQGAALVPVEPKVFDFLEYLIRNRERVVSREELIATVWQGRFISDSALATCISEARSSVADRGGLQRLIKTLPRKGLRFIGTVTQENARNPSMPMSKRHPAHLVTRWHFQISLLLLFCRSRTLATTRTRNTSPTAFVEDVISGLSRIKWLFVIARNSSFTYKGKPIDVRQVGRELGVRYVLEGSVRKAGNTVRVSGQLIDAQTGVHLWAERFDRPYDDIFALQDDLTMRVIGAIEPSLRRVEIEPVKRKRPDSLDAYDLVLRALPYCYGHTEEDAARAVPLLEKAIEIEPEYAAAHAPLAWCYHGRYRSGRRQEDRTAALHHARAAIAFGVDDATALAVAEFILALNQHDLHTAFAVFDRALELCNSNIFALSCSALIMSFSNQTEPAIERAQRALRMSPFEFHQLPGLQCSRDFLLHDETV